MSADEEREVWECNSCHHIEHKEEEVICWKCGKGEMIYQGKWWFEATPLICPTRLAVIKEDLEHWWKKHRGEPTDPNGFGYNLFHLLLWVGIIGVVGALVMLFG